MTNEEAVKVLEDMKVKISIPKAAELQRKRNEAIDMAIEALNSSEFPNNSDTVYRQAAIDLLEELETKRLQGDVDLLYAPMIKGLKALPSAESKVDKAFRLFTEWAVECDFGYDNIPREYEKYKDDIKGMNYTEGLIYIAMMEVEHE